MKPEIAGQIRTGRLTLRPFQESDLDDLAALNGDPETMKYISEPLTREQAAGVLDWFLHEWERLGFGWFAVLETQSGRFVGQCGLQCLEGKADSPDIELAFVIARDVWGKGYATEAAERTIRYAFEPAGLDRLVAVTMEENLPSRRVLEKLGFQFIDKRTHYGREVLYHELTPAAFQNRP